MINLRQYEKESYTPHPHFTFVDKDENWDFCMSASPAIVRSKDYFIEKDGKFCSHFIKANVPNLEDTFNRIAWQSAEAKRVLGGSRFPVADKPDVIKVYVKFLNSEIPEKKADWKLIKERAKMRKKHEYKI